MEHDWIDEMEHNKRRVWKRCKGGMPEKFKEIVVSYSVSDNYDEAIEEWIEVGNIEGYSATCICSHDIQICHYIANEVNNHKLIVGRDCIEKLCTKDMKASANARNKLRMYDGDKNPCLHCGTHSKHHSRLYCKQCVANNTITISRPVREEHTMKCWGDACDKLIFWGQLGGTSFYCDKCYAEHQGMLDPCCGGCLEMLYGKKGPRCYECYKDKMPIKCERQECWNMILYSSGPLKTRCDDCIAIKSSSKSCATLHSRSCLRQGCVNIIAQDAPAHWKYCSWKCTNL